MMFPHSAKMSKHAILLLEIFLHIKSIKSLNTDNHMEAYGDQYCIDKPMDNKNFNAFDEFQFHDSVFRSTYFRGETVFIQWDISTGNHLVYHAESVLCIMQITMHLSFYHYNFLHLFGRSTS